MIRVLFVICAVIVLSSCSSFEQITERRRHAVIRAEARALHSAWRTTPGWRSKVYSNEMLLARATEDNAVVEIALDSQRGFLLVDGAIAMDFPVATGKKSHPTPAGSYQILGKVKDYSSNLYGKIVDAGGAVVITDADTRTSIIPEGGSFIGARMPYWMRLTDTGVGMHVGYVPGRPASHGCIRLKREAAVKLFKIVKVGTPVIIATAPAWETATSSVPKVSKKR